MYYKKREQSKKVMKRIMRHKRTRYQNDAALFHEDRYSSPRKRTKSLLKRSLLVHSDADNNSSQMLS
jgi:Cu/Zn superoxide dismutase